MGARPDPAGEHLTKSLTVVVPVYNEGPNLRRWWDEAAPYLPSGSVVRVVYDFDADNTLPVVAELAGRGAPIEALRNTGRGVLDAIATGLRSVAEGPILISMADLSDDMSVLPRMLDRYRGGARVVVASRYMPGGRQIGGPWLKSRLAKWGSLFLHRVAGFPVHDATNSFRLYDAALVREMEFESRGGFEIGFEITLKAWMKGERIEEVPSTWRDRVAGESRFQLWKWLPHYGRLWIRALLHGFSRGS